MGPESGEVFRATRQVLGMDGTFVQGLGHDVQGLGVDKSTQDSIF